MASAPTSHEIDLEAQQVLSQPSEDVGGSETHEMDTLPGQSERKSNDSRASAVSVDQNPDPEVLPGIISQDERDLETGFSERSTHRSEDDVTRHTPTQPGQDENHTESQIQETPSRPPVLNDPPINATPGSDSDRELEEKRVIRDFDGSANAFWSLYGKEAKSHDESRIQTLKDDMDGVLIFAGLFSAVLTSFVIDSKQNLIVSPADQTVYYLQQNVAILNQISQQLSFVIPQVPNSFSPPILAFEPSASNIRINVFWFMALIFSLSAALLAILVQQWVRDYMHVFQRYSDPLKSARLRQYLHEGSEGWYMPVFARAVPGLLHVSLFLFFVGLCDSVFNINTTVGITTTAPIAVSGLLYTFTTFAPIIYPQSPYQTSFSGLIWYIIQNFSGRRFRHRGLNGALKPVNSNMAQVQMQLAMEEKEDRKGRDERAIRWLVSNMTEDAEMELFVMAIPGSFNGEWGVEVWKDVSNAIGDNKSTSQNEHSRTQGIFDSIIRVARTCFASDPLPNTAPRPSPDLLNSHSHSTTAHVTGEDTLGELSVRVAHMLETCKNRNLFASDELWRMRTRACIETTASLVFCAGAELGQFGDIVGLLGDIGIDQDVRESSRTGKDQSFVMCWTCLSLMAIRPLLDSDRRLRDDAQSALYYLKVDDDTSEEHSLTSVQKIIDTLNKASGYLNELYNALAWKRSLTKDKAKGILRDYEDQILELERIDIGDFSLQLIDDRIRAVQLSIDESSHGIITRHLPGVKSSDLDTVATQFSQFIELFHNFRQFQFIFPCQNLVRIRSVAKTFQDILDGQWNADAFQEPLENLRKIVFPSNRWGNMLHRQIWRLQDLHDGGGLGFRVELFFLALKQLLSKSSSKALYIGTFRAIISVPDRSEYQRSLGTQKLLLDMVMPDGLVTVFNYPEYIVDEFLKLLANILKDRIGPHIDSAVQKVTDFLHAPDSFWDPRAKRLQKVLGVITRA